MMGGWTLSDADRRLIPSNGLKGPVPLLFAIMLFIMTIAAGAGLAIANLSNRVSDGIEHRYTVQINDGQQKVSAALSTIRGVSGVAAAEAVPEAKLRKSLERWLGPASSAADLPIPALIDVDLKSGADAQAVAGRLSKAIPGATLRANADTLRPLLNSLTRLGWLALVLVILIGAAASAAVVMAARGALDSQRATIEVMHGIGATDRQIARLFLRQIAGEALLGGLVGTAAAMLVGVALMVGNGVTAAMAGPRILDWPDLVMIAVLPLLATGIAALVARRALMATLGERL